MPTPKIKKDAVSSRAIKNAVLKFDFKRKSLFNDSRLIENTMLNYITCCKLVDYKTDMNQIDKILEAIQNYPENDLTKDIIIPILKKMGFEKAEFFGGASEEGKDLVFWERDKLDDLQLHVAQVKHFKFTNSAGSTNSLQNVISQLHACFRKKIPHTDGLTRYPSKVWLISSNTINSKTFLTVCDDYSTIQQENLIIIDGHRLSRLIIKHTPENVKTVLGIQEDLNFKLETKFSNDILLKALGKKDVKDIKLIYTDVDFTMGKISTDIFFKAEYEPKKKKIRFNYQKLESLVQLCEDINDEYEINFLPYNLEKLKEKFTPLNKKSHDFLSEINIRENEIEKIRKIKIAPLAELNTLNISLENIDNELLKNPSSKPDRLTEKRNITNEIKQRKQSMKIFDSDIEKILKEIKLLDSKKNNIYLNVEIIGSNLAEQLKEKRTWIEKKILEINEEKVSKFFLKDFIYRCERIISTSTKILKFNNIDFLECVGAKNNWKYTDSSDNIRLRLPIADIFDVGLNLSILGEAGAGKSTSLEMFKYQNYGSDRIIFLIPLGYIVKDYESLGKGKDHYIENLILYFLDKNNINLSTHQLNQYLTDENSIVLLDGLDEAIKVNNDLPNLIEIFAVKYPMIQIILSSRFYGEYVDKIPFFAVTLLPFTTIQRKEFINKWFKQSGEKIAIKVIEHLRANKQMDLAVRNPLLTTTLCNLAENNLPLPSNELRLYEERLKLFTGYYDNVKHISKRIFSSPSILELIAQKIGYHLHVNNVRELPKQNILEFLATDLKFRYTIDEINLGFEELISPCEILVPMTGLDNYGLGHLRFQEHLAAKEIASNRSISYIKFIEIEWWYDVILFYLNINGDFENFIKTLGESNLINKPFVNYLLNINHGVQDYVLQDLVDKYRLLENGDIDEYDNSFGKRNRF